MEQEKWLRYTSPLDLLLLEISLDIYFKVMTTKTDLAAHTRYQMWLLKLQMSFKSLTNPSNQQQAEKVEQLLLHLPKNKNPQLQLKMCFLLWREQISH